jgi:hypothetical protein
LFLLLKLNKIKCKSEREKAFTVFGLTYFGGLFVAINKIMSEA